MNRIKNWTQYLIETEDLFNQRFADVLEWLCADVIIEKDSIRIDFVDGTWRYIEFPSIYVLYDVLIFNQKKWRQ
jgi:hypothetical protein